MKGRLSAESTPGKGSTFHFTAIFGLGKEEPTKQNTEILEGLQVLVVDDNDANRNVLQNMLQCWKMKVTAVESGAQAIVLLNDKNQGPFQYILLDTQMPVVDGFAVAQCLKNFPPARSANNCTVIMMLSSTAQRGIVEKHADLPISVYLSKPIVQFELLDALLKPFQKSESSKRYTESPSKVLIPPNQESKKGGRILLAEDNIVNQRLVLRILEKIGYTITVAENGLKAVQAYEKDTFDLVLMDVQMPEMGGFEATGKIREFENATGKRTPIIAMTAHAIQGYREKCLEAGMDGYISKPIRIEAVKKTIEDFVEKARNR